MKSINYLVFYLPLFAFYSEIVSGVGLHEDFTWTRINFEWPVAGEINSRFMYSSAYGRGKSRYRPVQGNQAAIVFEGFTNEPLSEDTSDKNQNNGNNENSAAGTVPGSIDYQYINNIPMGLNVWKDKLFISIPRRRLGVPATLNYISLNSKERHNVPFKPYPNWDINLYPDTSGKGENLISVYRFAIDPCDQMWIVDTGILELPGNRTYVRPQHQIVVVNLQNDQIIHRYNLPPNVITPATTLSSVTVDVTKGKCGDAYIYLPDLAGYGLIVYSLKENRSWRINHNYFFLESNRGDFSIAGHRFVWTDGVFSIEVSKLKSDGFKDAYFHSMAGTRQYKVSTRVLKNETLATRSYHDSDFQIIGDRGSDTQTSTAAIHVPTDVMFLGMVSQNALGCWNINKGLNTLSIVQRDDNKMIYPSDVKIVGDKVYVLTTTMPGFLYGRLDYNQINFRVWSNDVRSAVKGTLCES